MDSERKHELQTNDLKEFLENFKDFWDKYGNRLLLILIVGLGSWLAYTRYNQWKDGKAETAYNELNSADSSDAFRDIAGEHASVHDEAMRRSADAALGEARRALIAGDKEAGDTGLKKAGSAYAALIERGLTVEYQLVGEEGMAKVAVMREEWDKAASHYKKVIALAGETFLAQADRAQRSLERLELLKNPIAFAPPEEELPAPVPAPEGTTGGGELSLPGLPPLPLPIPAPGDVTPAE